MKARWIVCLMVAALCVSLAAPAAAGQGDKIVRTRTGLDGWRTITSACALLGCTVLRALDVLPGQTQGSSLFLVRGLVYDVVNFTLSLLGIVAIEPDLVATTEQDPWGASQASVALIDQLWDRTPMSYYGTTAWQPFLRQPAGDVVRVRDTHCQLQATGAAVVAVIDTGVDPDHPTLKPFLTGGYDFTRDREGGDERADTDVNQASVSLIDQYGVYTVNGATIAAIDQASVSLIDDPAHAAFAHGTMVSGVVHLVAPTAMIMPLKAFGANGQGYTSDVLRAIYYAVVKGAKVLNMSFSRSASSPELKRAIDNATAKGLIAVASAGNDSSATLVYPAAYGNVMGVASTTNDDLRSSFSNYGASLVWVAAPGEGVITTYPWASFAAAWGTSFSTPFVSGAAALLAGVQGSATNSQVAWAVSHAKPLTSDLGYGRLDLYQSVLAGRSLWPSGGTSPVPNSCQTSAVDWSPAP
jgi:Subtilase family